MIQGSWKVPNNMDLKLIRIQKSTRTLFGVFSPLHNWFRMKFRWYYNWHLNPYYKTVHYATLATYLLLLTGTLSYAVISHYKSSQATGNSQSIVQQIEMVNTPTHVIDHPSTYIDANSEYYKLGSFSGTQSIYFEAVIKSGDGQAATAALLDSSGNEVAMSSVATSGTSYTLVRSQIVTLYSGADYHVGIMGSNADINAARLVIIQSSAPITATETQIELGCYHNNSGNTIPDVFCSQQFTYSAAKFDGTVTAHFEATVQATNGDGTNITANLNDGNGLVKSLTSTSATKVLLESDSFTPVNGGVYTVSATMTDGSVLFGARLVINQQNAEGIQKLQTVMTLNPENGDASNMGFGRFHVDNTWDSANWQNATTSFTAYADLNSQNEAAQAEFQIVSNGVAIASMSYTSPSGSGETIASTPISLVSTQSFDGQFRGATETAGDASIHSAWITVDISLSVQSVTGITPATGCKGGLSCAVSWTAYSGADHYHLQYSIDNGSSWSTESALIATTSSSWTPPAFKEIGNLAKVRIIAHNTGNSVLASSISSVFSVAYGAGSDAFEQQINISSREISTSSNNYKPAPYSYDYTRDLQRVNYTRADYTNPSVYFEVSLKTTAGGTAFAALYDSSDIIVSGSQVSTTSTTYQRLSSPLLVLADGDDYTVHIKNSTGGTTYLGSSRLVILQTGLSGTILKTQTQIDLAEYSTGSYSVPPKPKYFQYDSANYDGTQVYYFEATTQFNCSVELTRDGAPTGNIITDNQNLPTRKRTASPITLTNGSYSLRVNSDGCYLYGAKLVIIQTNFTRLNTFVELNNYGVDNITNTSYVSQNKLNHWDSRNWVGHLSTIKNEAVLQSPGGTTIYNQIFAPTTAVTGSEVSTTATSWTRVTSDGSLTMPATPVTLDGQVRQSSGTGQISSSWLIVQMIPPLTISGTLRDTEGGQFPTSKTLALYVNKVRQPTTTTSGTDGTFSFTSQQAKADDSILIVVDDTDTTYKANFISQLGSSPANITGIEMVKNRIVLSSRPAGPITNTFLRDNIVTSKSLYTVDVSSRQITFDATCEVYIPDGKNYTLQPDDNYGYSSDDITLGSLKVAANGTFAPKANTVTVSGNWEVSPTATFTSVVNSNNPNLGGTVIFTSASDQTAKTGCTTLPAYPNFADTCNQSFYNIKKISAGATNGLLTFQAGGNLVVNKDFTIAANMVVRTADTNYVLNWYDYTYLDQHYQNYSQFLNYGTLQISTLNQLKGGYPTFTPATVELIGSPVINPALADIYSSGDSGSPTFTVTNLKISAGIYRLPSLAVGSEIFINGQLILAGGELRNPNNTKLRVSSFNQTGGIFTAFGGASPALIIGGVDTNGGSMAITGGVYDAPSLAIDFKMMANSTLNVAGKTLGPVTISNGSGSTYTMTIASAVTLNGPVTLGGSPSNPVTLTASASSSIKGAFSCGIGGGTKTLALSSPTWKFSSNIDLTNCTTVTPSTSTVDLDGPDGDSQVITTGGKFLNNLTHSGAGEVIVNDDTTLNASFHQQAGTFKAPSGTMKIGGNFQHTGGIFTHNNGTVNLNSITTAQTISGVTTFYNLIKSGNVAVANNILYFPAGATQTILNSATFLGQSITNRLKLHPTNNIGTWNIVLPATKTLDYLSVMNSDNSLGSSANLNSGNTNSFDENGNINWFPLLPPTAPSNVTTSSVTTGGFTVGWTNNSINQTGNKVYIAPTASVGTCTSASGTYTQTGGDLSSTSTTLPITNLQPNTLYCVKVEAYNTAGSAAGYSSAVYTLANKPNAPGVTAIIDNALKVTIDQNSNPASTLYSLKRSATCWLDWNSPATCGGIAVWGTYAQWGGAGGFSNTGLTGNTQYSYQVQAKNGVDTPTVLSDATSAYTRANVPSAPTVSGDWDVTNGYHLDVSINNNGNPSGTYYKIASSTDNLSFQYVVSDPLLDSSPFILNTGKLLSGSISGGIQYYVAVAAVNQDNSDTNLSPSAGATTPPAAPTISHSGNTTNSITWTWNAVATATSYKVYESDHSSGETDSICTTTSATTCNDTDAVYTPNSQHSVHVHAYNVGNIMGAPSNTASAYTSAAEAGLTLPNLQNEATKITASINNLNSNPDGVLYSITCNQTGSNSAKFLLATGSCGDTTPIYQTATLWGTLLIDKENPNAIHTYKVNSKNTDNEVTLGGTEYSKISPANIPSAPTLAGDWDGTSGYHLDVTIVPNSNPNDTKYLVQYFTAATGVYLTPSNEATWTTGSTFIFNKTSDNANLSPNTQYWIKVKARNSDGVETALSSSTARLTAPATPTDLFATNICSETPLISWSAVEGANTYKVYYGMTDQTDTLLDSDLATNFVSLPGLTLNTEYYVKVIAISSLYGEGPPTVSSPFTRTTCNAPLAPTDFHGTVDTTLNQIAWGWTIPEDSNPLTSMTLVGGVEEITLQLNDVSYVETNLGTNVRYTRQVRFTNSNGSTLSNIASKYTLAAPPDAPTLTAMGSDRIKILINDANNPHNPGDNTRYAIWNLESNKLISSNTGGFSEGYDYQLWSDWSDGSSEGTIINTGLLPNTSYQYHVISMNGEGVPAWTGNIYNVASNVSSPVATATLANVPGMPTVSAISWNNMTDGNSVLVTINENGNPDGTQYKVERKDGSGEFVEIAVGTDGVFPANQENFTDKNLISDTVYQYRVSATNNALPTNSPNITNSNAPVETNFGVAGSALTAPAQVTNFGHSANTANSVTWSWSGNAVAPAGYKVYEFSGGVCTNTDTVTPSPATAISATESSLVVNTQYSRCVRASRGSVLGQPSSSFSAYTSAITPTAPTLTAGDLQIGVAINESGNPSGIEYAVSCDGATGASWLSKTLGTCGGTAQWGDYTAWGSSSGVFNTGLAINTTHSYAVWAKNSDAETATGAVGSKYTLANAPTTASHTVASSTTSSITWTWQANSNPGNTEYYASTSAGNSGWTTSTSWTETGLSSANTQYSVTVKARNGDNFENGTTATANAYTAIETPTGISLVSRKPNSITMRVTGDFSNLATEQSGIQFANTTKNPDQVSSWQKNKNDWTSEQLYTQIDYYFTVQAKNAGGETTESVSASFSPTEATQLVLVFPNQEFVEGEGLSGGSPQQTAGETVDVTTYAVDGNLFIDSKATNLINLNSGDSQAVTEDGELTSGTVNLNLTLKTAGAQSVISSAANLGYYQQSVMVLPAVCSATVSTVSATPEFPETLTVGNNYTLAIRLVDRFGNILPNHQVSVSSNQAGDTITYYSVTTDSNGETTVYVTSAVPRTSTITVKDETDNVTLDQKPELTFVAAPIVPDVTPPEARIIASDKIIDGSEAIFDGRGSTDNIGIDSYSWDFGDQTQSTASFVSKKYSGTGSYVVRLIVTDTSGNENMVSKTVRVVPPSPVITDVVRQKDILVSTGTSAPSSKINLTIQSDPILVEGTSGADGKWEISYPIDSKILPDGNHIVTGTVTDNNQMVSDPSEPRLFTLTNDGGIIVVPPVVPPVTPPVVPPGVTPPEIVGPGTTATAGPAPEKPKTIADATSQIGAIVIASSVLSALVAAAPLSNASALFSFGDLFHFFNLPFLFFRNRRKKKWGRVIEAGTDIPISGAKVMLVKAENGTERIIEQTTTDKSGSYTFVALPGDYKIKVEKDHYLMVASSDCYIPDSTFAIHSQAEGLVNINVGMTMDEALVIQKTQYLRFLGTVAKVMNVLSIAILLFGTVITVMNLIDSQSRINILLGVFYLLVWFWHVRVFFRKSPWGKVVSADNSKPLPLVLVRVINSKNQLERTVVSNEDGRYSVVLKLGSYKLMTIKQGFTMANPLLINTKENLNTVNATIEMKKNDDFPWSG